MDTVPDPESPEMIHRRRRSSAWQRTPKGVKICVAICLGLLGISLLTRGRIMDLARSRRESRSGRAPESTRAPRVDAGIAFDSIAAKLPPIDLELAETSLNFTTHRIEGVAVNKSEHAYSNVRITFALPSADLTAQDSEIVVIPRLEPHASARFVSGPVPGSVRQWALVGITGTPR